MNDQLEIAFTSNDIESSQAFAKTLNGWSYTDPREKWQHLPFRTLVTVTTDDLSEVARHADVGLYVVYRRIIKPGTANVFGLFPMIHHPQKDHQQCDAHWRDNHGPLALEHHAHMTNYIQLSVLHTIAGPEVDGFALCGFDNESDLRNRFYTTKESVGVIAADVKRFADPKNSPPRLIATPTEYT